MNFGNERVATVTVDEALERQADGCLLLDVRTRQEWLEGRIPRALHTPLAALLNDLRDVDRDIPLVVYSQGGRRSARAAAALQTIGFTHVASLEGGFEAYRHRFGIAPAAMPAIGPTAHRP